MVDAGSDFRGALAAAYRRAAKLGLPVVGTDLVLRQAVIRTSVLGRHVGEMHDPAWWAANRGRSGLTDPDQLPEPSGSTPALDREAAFLAEAELREAAHTGGGRARLRARRAGRPPELPVFSPAVGCAVHEGLVEAARAGVDRAGAAHLVVGLLRVPGGAAGQLLSRVGGEDCGPDSDLVAQVAHDAAVDPGSPPTGPVGSLVFFRVVPPRHQPPRGWTTLWRLGIDVLTWRWMRRPYRRHGAWYGHPVVHVVELEADRLAVRAGHDVVTGAHVLASVLQLHEDLVADGRGLPDDVARWNRAGEILARHGATFRAATRVLVDPALRPDDDERRLDGLPDRGWSDRQIVRRVPPPGRSALAGLRAASHEAHRRGHPYAGTSHLLVELLADGSGPAARLLRRLDVDPEAVRVEARESLPG